MKRIGPVHGWRSRRDYGVEQDKTGEDFRSVVRCQSAKQALQRKEKKRKIGEILGTYSVHPPNEWPMATNRRLANPCELRRLVTCAGTSSRCVGRDVLKTCSGRKCKKKLSISRDWSIQSTRRRWPFSTMLADTKARTHKDSRACPH
jgi:hypothetical protein